MDFDDKSGRFAQKGKKNKTMNKSTRGIGTDGSGAFASFDALFTKAENYVNGSLPLYILVLME